MTRQSIENLIGDLRDALNSGAFAGRGRVVLSDGATVDPERMARIILADFERSTRDDYSGGLTEDDERVLYDDLLCLLALAQVSVAREASKHSAEE